MTTMMNGVDAGKLMETVKAVTAEARLGRFQFRLENRWIDGGENRSRIDGYLGADQEMRHASPFELVNDEPPVLLGADRAPNPVEYVLHALAGCLTTSLVYHAAARGITVRSVATRLEGDLDLRGFLGISADVRRGFQTVRVVFDVDADTDAAGKAELVAMAQKYSPVFDIVTHGLPVQCVLGAGAPAAVAA